MNLSILKIVRIVDINFYSSHNSWIMSYMSLDLVLLAKEIQRPIGPGVTTVLITRILAYVDFDGA